MGENSVTIWKMPSNLRSGGGVVTSTEMRAMTLGRIRTYSNSSVILRIPRLAQLYICNAILVAKCELYWAEGVECALVEPCMFLQRLFDKLTLIERYLSFTGHAASCECYNPRLGVFLEWGGFGKMSRAAEQSERASATQLQGTFASSTPPLRNSPPTRRITCKTSETHRIRTSSISVIHLHHDDRP